MVTILFDVDGTLLRFGSLGRDAMARAMEEVWGLPDPLDGIYFGGATDSGIAERVAPGRGRRAMWERYLVHLRDLTATRDGLAPLAGVVDLLDALQAHGARLALLTGNIRSGAEVKLDAVGLRERFDYRRSAFAEDGEERLAIAAAARRRCGDGPLIVVGDTVADIRCARHIDARVLSVTTGPEPEKDLRAAGPDRLAADLSATDDLAAWLLGRASGRDRGPPAPSSRHPA
ncbi:MAG: HAD family hydrolase [Planctomycetota bacterium]|jgi:phosphoglycolate phosphatase